MVLSKCVLTIIIKVKIILYSLYAYDEKIKHTKGGNWHYEKLNEPSKTCIKG
jgi:hypothetical protein